MTPGCLTCGYSVEWLRSCYSGVWRLFSNSPIVTPGYYYFSPPGTPFYPGSHNVGSRNWTTPEIQNPPLGEQTGKQTYRKGGLPVAFPAAVTLGNSSCIERGDSYPVDPRGRSFVAGIDTRCWTAAGQVAPDPSPALWLKPSALPPTTPGFSVFNWPDSSVFGRDASNYDPTVCPKYDTTTFPIATVDYSHSNTHSVPSFPLDGDYAIFVVGCLGVVNLGADPAVPICTSAIGVLTAPMRIGSTGLSVSTSGGLQRFPIDAGMGNVRLMAIRRVNGVITGWVRDALVGKYTDPIPLTFTVAVPAWWAFGPIGFQGYGLVELQVYDQPMSDAGFLAVQAALIAGYAL